MANQTNLTTAETLAEYEIPVLPERGIVVLSTATGGERFASLVRDVLQTIAEDAASRYQPAPLFGWWGSRGPEIEFTASRSRLFKDDMAVTLKRGMVMVFDAAFINRMPDDVAKVLIAHEIAHCYQYATGRLPGMSYQDAEDDAEAIIEVWGFDQGDLNGWLVRDFYAQHPL